MAAEKTNFKHIVLGLGGIGSSTLYWLSRKYGDDVLGIEQFNLGHHNGESQDHSRIIRLAYDIPTYTQLAKKAFKDWTVVEEESGTKLVTMCGGVVFGPKDDEHIVAYGKAMAGQKIPFDVLDQKQMKKRFPQFVLGPNDVGLYQSQSGIVDPRLANQVNVVLARARGAKVLENCPITKIEPIGTSSVKIYTKSGQVFTTGNLVITAGPWTNHAVKNLGIELPLTITQEQVTYFATPDVRSFVPSKFPVWVSYHKELCFYGFPVYGEVATKAGLHEGGLPNPVTPETRTFVPDEKRTQFLVDHLKKYIPGSLGPELYTKTCLYTLTPDRNFIVDTLPNYPQISVFVGSGHAYKFASVLGRLLSQLAEGKHDEVPELFKITRPAVWSKTNFLQKKSAL
eukprot:TRINITY_DN1212_c0_g1_i1.p1 TRINITY_DN1212_c0_g1~~TRINITY_DN1212_c0_g1_i1.p1  ORF type:complete len:397 (+),score=126.90 TRINITY_DN1212_c0_g1_i1:57-1247(+)